MMETIRCNYCDSADSTELYKIHDLYLNRVDSYYTLMRCNNCGLIYQNPRPSREEIKAAYPTEYEAFVQSQNSTWLRSKSLNLGIEKRCHIVNSVKREKGRILDIGCATGQFLHAMQSKHAWEAYGVEINEFPANIAKNKYQLNVFYGSLEQASYSSSFFDAVTLWDVLEHLPDPNSTLQEVRRIIKPDGILVMRVPNFDSWEAEIFGPAWAGLDVPRHYFVFSKDSLLKLLYKNGFAYTKMESKFGNFPMFVISIRFWMNMKSLNPSVQRVISGLINNPVTQILTYPIFFLIGAKLRSSLITSISSQKLGTIPESI
jgi:2-polyprenyl-3-methyl-5-hydroxy-6-metoxy-1,4-benzoquinol methylase